jgi:hypothetical protein
MKTNKILLRAFVSSVSVLILIGCINAEKKENTPMNSKNNLTGPQNLEKANPAEDLAADIKNGQLHFLAIRGYALSIPGVKNYYERFAKKIPLKIVEGSDAIRSNEERKLRELTIDYARQYNLLLLKHLEEHSY